MQLATRGYRNVREAVIGEDVQRGTHVGGLVNGQAQLTLALNLTLGYIRQ